MNLQYPQFESLTFPHYKLSKEVHNNSFSSSNQIELQNFQKSHVYQPKIPMDDPIQEFRNWYFTKPVVTRTYMTGSVILGILTVLNILTPYNLYYDFTSGILNFQVWRLFTTVLFHGKLSFSFIFSMYFANYALNHVETQLFDRRKSWADFIWLLIMLHSAGIVIASFFPIYFTSDAFIFSLMYIWCKRRPFETITLSLMFIPSGIRLKSGYFPWFYMGFNILLGQSWIVYLVGLMLGHLYIFFKDIMLPKTHKDYLQTPKFFKNWIQKRDLPNPDLNQGQAFGGQGARL